MNERDLFIAAVQIDDPAKRSAFLDTGCGADAELLQRVEALLQAFAQAGSFMQHAHLGHREEAMSWYDRVLAWVERNRQELQKFPSRLEADKQLQAAAEEALKLEGGVRDD